MGWLDKRHQRKVRRKYHVRARYLCDFCKRPISQDEMPLIDTKHGYFPWPDRTPITCRSFLSREPKVTYHLDCDYTRRGKKRPMSRTEKRKQKEEREKGEYMPNKKKSNSKKSHKEDTKKKSSKSEKSTKSSKVSSKVKEAMSSVVKLVMRKPSHYDKKSCIRKLKDKYEKADVRKACKSLWDAGKIRKKAGGYILVDE